MIEEKLAILPNNPGCYIMKNSKGNVIYVGKAKNLKNRVRSYFRGSHNAKTTALVNEIFDFEYIITKTEQESLILEIQLIKKYDPRYNIKLTDDKTYPYIVLTNENHPRLIVSRQATKRLGKRFGPYPNVYSARETVKLLNKVYPLRKCMTLPKKECLYYHIKQCLAPCINVVDEALYQEYITNITHFLRGNTHEFLSILREKMKNYSNSLEFEQAQDCLNLINHIETTVAKQTIVLQDYIDRDIFGYYANADDLCIQVFFMRAGAIVARDSVVLGLVDEVEDLLVNYIVKFYETHEIPQEILMPKIDYDLSAVLDVNISYPVKSDKKRLLDMVCENAKMDLEKKNELLRNKAELRLQAVDELCILLHLPNLSTMEMFDNSNTFGEYPVSSMIVYRDGYPSKKDYRKFNVKTVSGPDDYQTMKEVVYRRYYRLLMEKDTLPDLLVMDGGVGQTNAALEIITNLGLKIPVIGLKKNAQHQTESIIFNNQEIPLNKHSHCYRMLVEMQEEVHEFAINFHRKKRSSGMLSSLLDGIDGVGAKRKVKLLTHFKSISAMKEASIEDYVSLGFSEELAKRIMEHLSDN